MIKWPRAVAMSLLSLALGACTALRPNAWPKGSGEILLSFDDGPTSGSAQLLDVLKKHRVKATFCLIGRNVAARPEVVERMVREGHAVSNHSYNHRLLLLNTSRMNEEIRTTDQAIQVALSNASFRTGLFRPPYGLITPAAAFSKEASTRQMAYLTMYLGDAEVDAAGAPKLMARVKQRLLMARGGAIVFHEMRYVPSSPCEKPSKEWLPAAIDDLIVWAGKNGLAFCTYRSDRLPP